MCFRALDFSNVHVLIFDKGYIRDTRFSPKNWAAPGRVNESCMEVLEAEDIQGDPENRPERTRPTGTALQGKTIADVFEALIGNRT